MTSLLSSRRLGVGVLLFLFFALGCRSSQAPQFPVRGKVTVDGQAVPGGNVSLIPQPPPTDGKSAGFSAGQIDSSGNYIIYTGGKEGAPLGKYKVTVTPPMMPSSDGKPPTTAYNRDFSDPAKTTLVIEVVASPGAGAYNLELTK
jgi:hypothetical protein